MDMEAGGTWIAAAEHGLALCLLNLNLEPPPDLRGMRGLKSRGLVIPALIGAADVTEAVRRLERLSLKSFAPFRLVAVTAQGDELVIAEARWDRKQIEVNVHTGGPACFVSSGLGDSLVADRIGLFDRMVASGASNESIGERQDEYHRHTWPDRPELSVLMSRTDARTVSVTTIEAMPDGRGMWDIAMEYDPIKLAPEVNGAVGGKVGGVVEVAGVRRAAGAR